MGRHATREAEVDRLLRGEVFVDLYRAVRQGLRASVESYSIKKLEPLYGLTREEDLRDAGSSIVAFESLAGRSRSEIGAGAASAVARARDARDPAQHRGLQPRRLRLELAAAGLAGGAPTGAGAGRSGEPLPRPAPRGAGTGRAAVRAAGPRRGGGGTAVRRRRAEEAADAPATSRPAGCWPSC